MIVTDELARRFEMAEAVDAAGCAEAAYRIDPECKAATKGVAGGYLAFCGSSSPLTHAIGIGMHGPVTTEEILEVEKFFMERDAPVILDLCPHADPSLRDILFSRRYRLTDYNNLLVRRVSPQDDALLVDQGMSVTETSDETLYCETLTQGFFGRDQLTPEEEVLGNFLFHMPCSNIYLAHAGGAAVGACALSIRNGIANCFGDATLPEHRGRGVHRAMIHARLLAAFAAGCEYVIAATQPGSISQRNYQRAGFEVAYSRFTMMLERA